MTTLISKATTLENSPLASRSMAGLRVPMASCVGRTSLIGASMLASEDCQPA